MKNVTVRFPAWLGNAERDLKSNYPNVKDNKKSIMEFAGAARERRGRTKTVEAFTITALR